jgi:YesN/AraC family two-component response regulator
VYEIAEAMGFKDMKHFHAIFKRKTGLSPREYRKRTV